MTTTARPPCEPPPAAEDECGKLQHLIEGLPVGIYRSTPSGQILAVNPAMVRLMGYVTSADLAYLNAADLYVDPADRSRWKEIMDRDGVVRAFDCRARRADGEIVWVRDTARAVRDDAGQVLYYEGILEDVSERKRIREALRESEERSNSIFETAPIGMAITSPEGRYIKVNHALCEMLGYGADELTALATTDVTHPDHADRERQDRERLLQHRRVVYEVDRQYVRKNGTAFSAHLTARVIRDESGGVLYVLSMVENIDEERRAQAALEEANEKLTRSLAELNQRTRRVTLLTEMTDLLQSCRTLDEAYPEGCWKPSRPGGPRRPTGSSPRTTAGPCGAAAIILPAAAVRSARISTP